jgi:biotin carboxylase
MAHVLVIELPGGNDADLLHAAVDRGDEFTFLSCGLDHYRQQPALHSILARARETIEINPFDYDAVEQRVLHTHARCRLDAVLCLIDIRLREAARLAARLGLKYLNPASAELLRDKYRVRQRLATHGVAQPAHALAESNEELERAVERLGLPVIIKPVDGYGSQNIVALRHPEDLDPLLTPLRDMLPSRADYGFGVAANDRMLVERYLTGTVLGCDTLTSNGRHVLLGVHEKQFFAPPSFAIRGGSFTPNCADLRAVEQYVFSALDAVGFDWGAAHTEVMLTEAGPQIIEINPRLVGAKIARLVAFALDRSIHADVIALHLGAAVSEVGETPSRVAVSRWITAHEEGILDSVQIPNYSDPRIRCVEILKRPGDYVRPPLENVDRIGYIMVCGTDRLEAEQLADAFVSQCHCRMRT